MVVFVLFRRELRTRQALETTEMRLRARTAEIEAAHQTLLDDAAARARAEEQRERLSREIDGQRLLFQTVAPG